jgi:hypothetical protein
MTDHGKTTELSPDVKAVLERMVEDGKLLMKAGWGKTKIVETLRQRLTTTSYSVTLRRKTHRDLCVFIDILNGWSISELQESYSMPSLREKDAISRGVRKIGKILPDVSPDKFSAFLKDGISLETRAFWIEKAEEAIAALKRGEGGNHE